MQNLIVGERYYFKHGEGAWEGYVTVDDWSKTFIDVSDIEVVIDRNDATSYYKRKGNKSTLGGPISFWKPELVEPLIGENE